MVMLYQDPSGESVGKTPSMDVSVPKFSASDNNQSVVTEEKVILLERSVQEKESRINELTLEIATLKVSIQCTVIVGKINYH